MNIDFSQSGLSAHKTLPLMPLIELMAEIGGSSSVVVAGPGSVLTMMHERQRDTWVLRPAVELSTIASQDLTRAEGIDIGYQYRDGANYKSYAVVRATGTPRLEDLSIILTAMSLGDDAAFIPGQVGLPNLQSRLGDGDWTEDDHVWHTLEQFDPAGQSQDTDPPIALGDLVRQCRTRITLGYDIIDAMHDCGAY